MLIKQFTKTGLYHLRQNQENQDAAAGLETRRFQGVVLADGVSACPRAAQGARLACQAALELMEAAGERLFTFEPEKTAYFIVAQALDALRGQAALDGAPPEDYSSTLVLALLDRQSRRLLYFSLGDSLPLAVTGDKCDMLAPPADSAGGCPVTTTRGAELTAACGVLEAAGLRSVLLCSDGAWRLMYRRDQLREEARDLLLAGDFDGLSVWLDGLEAQDDCTCIAMDIWEERGL